MLDYLKDRVKDWGGGGGAAAGFTVFLAKGFGGLGVWGFRVEGLGQRFSGQR